MSGISTRHQSSKCTSQEIINEESGNVELVCQVRRILFFQFQLGSSTSSCAQLNRLCVLYCLISRSCRASRAITGVVALECWRCSTHCSRWESHSSCSTRGRICVLCTLPRGVRSRALTRSSSGCDTDVNASLLSEQYYHTISYPYRT